VISTQPASLSLTAGNGASFSVSAGGTPTPTFQWQRNGANLGGATGSTYTVASVQSADAGDYTVVVTNALGSVTSAKATLAVTAAPVPPPPASSGGGGGGAPSIWFLLSLGTLRLLRRLGLRPRWGRDRRRT
jgi:ribosomal protein L30E